MVHRGTIGLVRITFLALALGQYLVEAHQSLQLSSTRTRGGSSTAVSDEAATTSNMATDQTIKVVFSDVDGTLAHYPEDVESIAEERGNKIVRLPPSSTGMRGIISSRTFVKAKQIREKGVKLVLISGMRTATLLKRLPYLPRADAYCSEAGGRIFYPSDKGFLIEPVEFDGASKEDLQSFCITEDIQWRLKMEQPDAAGKEGYIGNPFDDAKQEPVPVELRTSALWTHAQHLVKLGYVIDSKGYSSCFRLTRNQQEADAPDGDFDDLMNGKIACPPELGTSTNLGSVDFYPIASGKKNWYVLYSQSAVVCCEPWANRQS